MSAELLRLAEEVERRAEEFDERPEAHAGFIYEQADADLDRKVAATLRALATQEKKHGG